MTLFFLVAVSFAAQNLALSPKNKEHLMVAHGYGKAMSEFYLSKAENYGKKDWSVNAAGVARWIGKLEAAWKKQVFKCGDGYWEQGWSDRPQPNFENMSPGNEVCNNFNAKVNGLVEWTHQFMADCSYVKEKKRKRKVCTGEGEDKECKKEFYVVSSRTVKMEGKAKFIKKWKKIMIAFHGAMKNHPKGAKCDSDWTPVYADEQQEGDDD